MAEPFEAKEPDGRPRMLGSGKRVASREIETLLAETSRISSVEARAVSEIAERHKCSVDRHLRTSCVGFYRRFLEHCLLDDHLSSEEREDLDHLRRILCIDEATAARVLDDVAMRVYGQAIDQVLADHRLDEDESAFLRELSGQLAIPNDVAQALIDQGVERARQRFFSKTAARSGVFLTQENAPLQLVGSSEQSIEAAVADALEPAFRVVPRLQTIELGKVRAELDGGRVARWFVEVHAWLAPED